MEEVDFSDITTAVDYRELTKLAIKWADGVILNSENVDSTLVEYARSLNKPMLEYQTGTEYANACHEFYEQLHD